VQAAPCGIDPRRNRSVDSLRGELGSESGTAIPIRLRKVIEVLNTIVEDREKAEFVGRCDMLGTGW
jgi:hypothetical protein